MIEYVTHYYNKKSVPFQTLSALSKLDALEMMNKLCDDSPLFARFKTPKQYFDDRQQVENWLRDKFMEKKGQPKEQYPIYAVLGSSYWIEKHSVDFGIEACQVKIPITIFGENDISFTLPDSMVSYSLEMEKPDHYYKPEYHGKIFTLSEVKAFINKEMIDNLENTLLPGNAIPYVEAQIWNHKLIRDFVENDQFN